jgi:hypothetical protein
MLLVLFTPFGMAFAQTACPPAVTSQSLSVQVTSLEKTGGSLKVGYSVRNGFNVPMQIHASSWGRDVSRAFDARGNEWPMDKSASRMDRWANTSDLPMDAGMAKSGSVLFTRISGDVSAETFDFTLLFSAMPAGAPGSALGKTRMIPVRIRGVPVDCIG